MHVDEDSLLTMTGPSVYNAGDFIVPSLHVEVYRWTNTKTVAIAQEMTGRIVFFDDQGETRINRDLVTRSSVLGFNSRLLTSPQQEKIDLIINRPDHIFDGSEFSNLTVSGVLKVYEYGLSIKDYWSFSNIHQISFELTHDTWISGGLNVRGGIDITTNDLVVYNGKLSSKGDIILHVKNGLLKNSIFRGMGNIKM